MTQNMEKELDQEKNYKGLLSLDNQPPGVKFVNFILTVIIGTWHALGWNPERYFLDIANPGSLYSYSPFSWHLILLFPWPICAVILWLRLSGLAWHWSLLAAFLILVFFYLLASFFSDIGRAFV
jgi:hypothetical protein